MVFFCQFPNIKKYSYPPPLTNPGYAPAYIAVYLSLLRCNKYKFRHVYFEGILNTNNGYFLI